ncbi:MAG: response regulator [Actinomycetota bacterium]
MANVLIADDDVALRRVFRLWLEEAGYAVEEATNGMAALDRLARGGIDAVVLDVVMPGVDGIDVLRALRDSCHGVRIVAVSGGGMAMPAPVALKLMQALGVEASLLKPVARDELLHAIAGA